MLPSHWADPRDFVTELERIYVHAGKPSYAEISSLLGGDPSVNELEDIFSRRSQPNWGAVEKILSALFALGSIPEDEQREKSRRVKDSWSGIGIDPAADKGTVKMQKVNSDEPSAAASDLGLETSALFPVQRLEKIDYFCSNSVARARHDAVLVAKSGPHVGAIILLEEETSVGRHPDSDLLIDDKLVSRRHASFRRATVDRQVEWLICDVGSINGTYLNGESVKEPSSLKTGDVVLIGRSKLVFIDLATWPSLPSETRESTVSVAVNGFEESPEG